MAHSMLTFSHSEMRRKCNRTIGERVEFEQTKVACVSIKITEFKFVEKLKFIQRKRDEKKFIDRIYLCRTMWGKNTNDNKRKIGKWNSSTKQSRRKLKQKQRCTRFVLMLNFRLIRLCILHQINNEKASIDRQRKASKNHHSLDIIAPSSIGIIVITFGVYKRIAHNNERFGHFGSNRKWTVNEAKERRKKN